MLLKDFLFMLEGFSEDTEVCFWSNGKAYPVEVVKDDKTRNCILLNAQKGE